MWLTLCEIGSTPSVNRRIEVPVVGGRRIGERSRERFNSTGKSNVDVRGSVRNGLPKILRSRKQSGK